MHRRARRFSISGITPMQVLAVLVTLAVLATFTTYINRAQAVITTPFSTTFSANANGSIVLRGNSNLRCPAAANGCTDALDGTGSAAGEALNNNGYVMQNQDVDADAGTFNSSSAGLTLPAGSTVLFAALYWSANVTAGTNGTPPPDVAARTQVKFAVPGQGYATVVNDEINTSGNAYQSYANVTDKVAGAGNGTYTVADIQAGLGQDRYAGWALVVAYQNPAENMRNLRIYDGFGIVSSGSTSVDIAIGGFQTPQYGTVTTTIGTVVYEGDLGKTGDTLKLNNVSMTDAQNPANNFFNSTVSQGGTPVTGRDPAQANLLGVDVDQFDASGKIANNATGATLTLTTAAGGETFYPGVVTFTTDLYAPNLTATMTGRDVGGGDLVPGDEIEYTVDVVNDGTDTAIESVLSDAVPAGTTYVPGSLAIAGTPVTDATADDRGNFRTDTAQGAAVFRIGTGATATTGGRLIPGATARVTFRVKVNVDTPAGTQILNAATVDYTGENTGRLIAGTSSAAAVTVRQPKADLAAGLTAGPPVVQRGGADDPVSYLLTVTNNGTDLEPRARGVLTLPDDVVAGPLPSGCAAAGQVVTCDLGPLAVGTSVTRQIDASVTATAVDRAPARLVAAGTGNDQVPGNNTATASVGVNARPTAQPDADGTTNGHPVNLDVLDNDSDPDGDALAVQVTQAPAHGGTSVQADGTITYTPALGWAGTDTFTYSIDDGRGGTAGATVTVTVANAAPIARDDSAGGPGGTPVTVEVLANDSDPNPADSYTVTAVTQPAGGTVTFTAGDVTFTPQPSFSGPVTFTYTVTDNHGATATAQVAILVGNNAPHAADDAVTVPYHTDKVVTVLAGDTDPDNDALTVVSVTQPAKGSVQLAGGVVTYRAPAGFSGTTTFTYTISDGHSATATATVTVTVPNAPPSAADVIVSGPYGHPIPIDVVASSSDPNGDPRHVTNVTAPAHGTVTEEADGTLTYVGGPGWSGADGFDYTIADNHGGTHTAHVTVTVDNAPPSAQPAAVTAETGVALVVPLPVADPNNDTLTLSVDVQPLHGTAQLNADNTVTYTPAPGYRGPDSFHYRVLDGRGGADGATVSITVVDSPPTARPDAEVTPTDTAVELDVLANDNDPGGGPLAVTGFTNGGHGTVTLTGTGKLLYTPAQGFSGVDTFTYTAGDQAQQGGSSTVTVTVLNHDPIAVDDTVKVHPGRSDVLDLLANDTDPNTGQVLRVKSVSGGKRGTLVLAADGTVTYRPGPGSTGTDTFDYVVTDDAGGEATGSVVVTVDQVPVAGPDVAVTASGAAADITVLANDTDPEQQQLTVTAVSDPAHGTARLNADGTVRYTPATGFTGEDTFTYTVRDAAGNTATNTVTVTVRNAAPVATPDQAAVAAGGRVEIAPLANDTDVNPGQTLTVESLGTPAHGRVTRLAGGRVRYEPAAGYTGPDSFTYVVSDGHDGLATGTVTVTVSEGLPVALPDTATTPYRHPVTVAVLGNDLDPDGGGLTVTAVTRPADGTVSFTGGAVTYRPSDTFTGVATFTYTVTDSDGNTATATVTVTVGTPPAVPDKATTAEPGSPVTIGLPSLDKHDRAVTIVAVGTPKHGIARLGAGGKVVYTPEKGFAGTDSFTYTARDADGNYAMATVKVTVAGPQRPPAAADDAVTVTAGRSVQIKPLGNDRDPDGDKLTIAKIGKPRHGTAVLIADGTITYAPVRGYEGGTDTFTYTVKDGHGGTDTATVTVTIDEAPAAAPVNLPRTGDDVFSVVGTGLIVLLLGAGLYWFGMRGSTAGPVLAGAAAGRPHGPGRHRPGRHAAGHRSRWSS